ncbi:MAG: elongation factor P [Planctomycetes bacterium]|nr:elongation factor P [Planctomycetota bacterium]
MAEYGGLALAQISTSDFKNGMTILHRNELYDIVEFQFVKPGKGGAFVRTKLKNVKTGSVLEHTFDSKDKVDQAIIEKKEMEYLYRDGDSFIFMDQETFEQHGLNRDLLEHTLDFLKENTVCHFKVYKDEFISISLPDFMIFTITETAPYIKGSTAQAGSKPAQIETGTTVQVPVFVTEGEKIRIDTRNGKYMERAND